MSSSKLSGLASVNGLDLFYEVHGEGSPLILLHGGLCSTQSFEELIPQLTSAHRVIAIDFQAHGGTADIDRPLTPEALADDVVALLDYLKLEAADVFGYSLGAAVGLRFAIQHPQRLRKLVAMSFPFKRVGWYPEIREAMSQMGEAAAEGLKGTPIHQTYLARAPRPEDWSRLISKMHLAITTEYDWTTAVSQIQSPTMLIAGDADSIPVSHMAEFFSLLGGGQRDGGWDGSGVPTSRLAILPGYTHYNLLECPYLAELILPFLAS